MATIVLPQPPEPLRLKPPPDGLKPETIALLGRRGRHLREADIPNVPFQITTFDVQVHGPRFLWFWYHLVYQLREHAALWGAMGLDGIPWLATFSQTTMHVLHRQQAPWYLGEGLIMVVWLDDRDPGAHTRVHVWAHPSFRHPSATDPYGRMLLDYLFRTGDYNLLEARIPAPNKTAYRWSRRLGFRHVARLPQAEWFYRPNGERHLVDLLYSIYTRADWDTAQRALFADPDVLTSPRDIDERTDTDGALWDTD